MKDVKALIQDARLPETTVEVCLQADLQAEFESLQRQLEEARRRPTDSLAGNGSRDIAERIEALRCQMADSIIEFRIRAMPRKQWRDLVAAHQPRKDGDDVHEQDRFLGVNTETFFDALIRASVVDPELDDDDWTLLLEEKLTDRQFDAIADAAWGLNRRDVDVPFSPAASKILNSEPG